MVTKLKNATPLILKLDISHDIETLWPSSHILSERWNGDVGTPALYWGTANNILGQKSGCLAEIFVILLSTSRPTVGRLRPPSFSAPDPNPFVNM